MAIHDALGYPTPELWLVVAVAVVFVGLFLAVYLRRVVVEVPK